MRCRCRPPPRTPALISGSANRARCRRDDHVAARDERQAGADRSTVDGADHRERAVAQRPEAVAHDAAGIEQVNDAVAVAFFAPVPACGVVQVDTTTERALAGRGEDRDVPRPYRVAAR